MKFSENVLSTIKNDLDRDFFQSDTSTYYHSLRVGNAMEQLHPLRYDLNVLALLHDVINCTNFTIDDLKAKYKNLFHYELGDETAAAVFVSLDALSKRKDETYGEYIGRVKTNENASRVKILDLADDIYTLTFYGEDNTDLLKNYVEAMKTLTE